MYKRISILQELRKFEQSNRESEDEIPKEAFAKEMINFK